MPEGFQQGDVGQQLDERASTLEYFECQADFEEFDEDSDTDRDDWVEEQKQNARDAVEEIDIS